MLQLTLLPNYKMQKAGSPWLQHPKMTAHSRKKHNRQAVHLCNVRQLQHPKKAAHSRKNHIKTGRQAVHLCNVRQLQNPKMTAHLRKNHIKTGRQSISAMFASCNTPKKPRIRAKIT